MISWRYSDIDTSGLCCFVPLSYKSTPQAIDYVMIIKNIAFWLYKERPSLPYSGLPRVWDIPTHIFWTWPMYMLWKEWQLTPRSPHTPWFEVIVCYSVVHPIQHARGSSRPFWRLITRISGYEKSFQPKTSLIWDHKLEICQMSFLGCFVNKAPRRPLNAK
jgi:hypothetical protein